MDKIAQKRSLLNRLHEMANVPARSAEEFFKPELKRVMNVLIDADDVVRSTLAGSKVGKATPEDPISAKDLLKEAKSFINRREYLSAVASLGRFHKKMSDVASVLKNLDLNVNNIHHRFLFEKLPGKHKEQLENMRSRFASEQSEYFIKEANIMDFFHNIGTQRGRALAAWEKRYPKVVGKIREGAISQLENAQNMLEHSLTLLKTMASARAGRNIDAYLEASKELTNAFNKYDNGKGGFKNYYTDVIRPYLDTQAKIEAEEATKVSVPDSSKVSPVGSNSDTSGTVPAGPLPDAFKPAPGPGVTGETLPGVAPPTQSSQAKPGDTLSVTPLPPPPNVPSDVTPVAPHPPVVPSLPVPNVPEQSKLEKVHQEIMKEWEAKNKSRTSSYNSFIESLEVFSNEDPALLAAHISTYARSIQVDDPNTAIQLFKISKSLRR